jgi:hypothetical protein
MSVYKVAAITAAVITLMLGFVYKQQLQLFLVRLNIVIPFSMKFFLE